MFTPAGFVFDVYDDSTATARRIVAEGGLPSADEVRRLPDRSFAVVLKTAGAPTVRRFPLVDAATTKVAAAYFNRLPEDVPERIREVAGANIAAAAKRFDVPVGAKLAARARPDVRTNEVLSEDVAIDTTPVSAALGARLTKEAAFASAQREFVAQYDRMSPPARVALAAKLAQHGDVTESRVRDYVPSERFGPLFKQAVLARHRLLRNDPVLSGQLLGLVGSFAADGAKQAAVQLHQFDRIAGIEGRVEDAFRSCWGGVVKAAAPLTDPASIRQHKLLAVARDHGDAICGVLESSAYAAFTRDPIGFYATAKPALRRVIDRLCDAVGSRRAASVRQDWYHRPPKTREQQRARELSRARGRIAERTGGVDHAWADKGKK